MPTGYTAAIADGIDFNTFVIRCARGMGALIMMRDAPMDAPIPERFEPSDYHSKKIEEAVTRLERLRSMDDIDAYLEAWVVYNAAIKSNSDSIRKSEDLREKYKEMLEKVQRWEPPTSDHEGLKNFMIKQITSSLGFDCDIRYYTDNPPTRLSGPEWKEQEIKKVLHVIEYHTEEHSKEVRQTEQRNKWLQELRISLEALK